MYPINYDDVLSTRARLGPFLDPSPVRHYPPLDELVGQAQAKGNLRVFIEAARGRAEAPGPWLRSGPGSPRWRS